MGKLDGKTAIVTGGAHGLGRQFAGALAREGATVAILDIADADTAAAEFAGHEGNGCFGIAADVSSEASVQAAVGAVLGRTGRIDILVNNAAVFSILPPVGFENIDVALWDKVMAVNLRGPFLMAKHAAPAMIARKAGKIVNIASGTAYKGMPLMLHYVTSKGGVVSFTRALSRELGAHNICVNTLAPGLTLSDSILANPDHLEFARDRVVASRAIRRDGHPEDLLGALIFLCSPDSDFITGQTIAVDGGSINT
ncbi:MAG TPA: SDR family oxidoreductase [Hyphomicrobiaceae bacterium]|nr:SDR family oxidoreductase [Hyphomicrobiaceae bacterium]